MMTIKKVIFNKIPEFTIHFLKPAERVTEYPKLPPLVVTGVPPVITGGLRWSANAGRF